MGSRLLPPLAAFLFLAHVALTPIAVQAQTPPVYLALGDSLAFGVGADSPEAEGYVGLTEATLKADARFSSSGLDLVNLSAPGATSADLVQADGQLDRAVSEIESKDVQIISLSIGGNDLLALAANDSPCVLNAGSKACQDALSRMLGTLQANLSTMLQRLRQAAPRAEIYVVNLYNPYSGSADSREIIASVGVQQANGVIGAAGSNPDFGAKLVSVFELFQGRSKEWIASDGIHPNNDGYRVMAEALLAAIQNQPIVIPEDLVAHKTDAPTDSALQTSDGGGVDTILVLVALPVAFGAGALLSAAYFVMRGRA